MLLAKLIGRCTPADVLGTVPHSSKKESKLAVPAHPTKALEFSDDEDVPSDDVSLPSRCRSVHCHRED
jgi:hypothetical protein